MVTDFMLYLMSNTLHTSVATKLLLDYIDIL